LFCDNILIIQGDTMQRSRKTAFLAILFISLSFFNSAQAGGKRVKYKTRFENCPSQVLGRLTLKLIKSFESNRSLYSVKEKIIDEKLAEIYYLKDYKISFNPLKNLLDLYFSCPVPAFKLEFINNKSGEDESGVLAQNGVTLSNGYLSLLQAEGKFLEELPIITLVDGNLEKDVKLAADAGNLFKKWFSKELSELVVDKNRHLTAILSVDGHPITIFLGEDKWKEKLVKLKKTITYLDKRTRLPRVINLRDIEKVVVKFSSNK